MPYIPPYKKVNFEPSGLPNPEQGLNLANPESALSQQLRRRILKLAEDLRNTNAGNESKLIDEFKAYFEVLSHNVELLITIINELITQNPNLQAELIRIKQSYHRQ